MTYSITPCADAPAYLLWDSVWQPGQGLGEWSVGAPDRGLLATDPVGTALINLLFTDRRCPPGHPLEKYIDGTDRRGWWGDGIDVRDDLFEIDMGSLLWCIENTVATEDIRRWAENLAFEALQPLLNCGLAASITCTARIVLPSAIVIDIALAGSLQGKPFNRKFDSIWRSRA